MTPEAAVRAQERRQSRLNAKRMLAAGGKSAQQIAKATRLSRNRATKAVAREGYAGKLPKVPKCAGVYVVGSTELGVYKIGMASSLRERLRAYASLPFKLDYLRVWGHKDCRTLERTAHQWCSAFRMAVNGAVSEWFKLAPCDLWGLESFLSEHTWGATEREFRQRAIPVVAWMREQKRFRIKDAEAGLPDVGAYFLREVITAMLGFGQLEEERGGVYRTMPINNWGSK